MMNTQQVFEAFEAKQEKFLRWLLYQRQNGRPTLTHTEGYKEWSSLPLSSPLLVVPSAQMTPELTAQQKLLQARRLHLEEQMWTSQMYLADVKRECTEHVLLRGWIRWSPAKGKVVENLYPDGASCAVCGEDLGWYCPVNPKGYCEYESSEDCIHCHQPSERK